VERGGGVAEASWPPRLSPLHHHPLPLTLTLSCSPQTCPSASGGGTFDASERTRLSSQSVDLFASADRGLGEEREGRGGGGVGGAAEAP
jgi:hypothetical protein